MRTADKPQESRETSTDQDLQTGPSRKNLEGWLPLLAGPEEIRDALCKAFEYRGDVTITLKNGETLEGYVFDRKVDSPSLDQCLVRLFPKEGNKKIAIAFSDIARLAFIGRDTAAGRRFEVWLRSHHGRNTSLEPEPL
jgi:hypothetical protein